MKVNRVLSLLILTFAFSCSTFYDATGKGTIKSTEAAFQLQNAVYAFQFDSYLAFAYDRGRFTCAQSGRCKILFLV
ncbi:hypothetical protein [Leptospira stimsonii]|uniref:hypothetical protein n=1 Tax=Leptospira stimsonii TaxID=2202203 RepID=UPI0011C3C1C0|nr:hypothetical protein [Leptospira stimsonii]